jgi:hypothetical protein
MAGRLAAIELHHLSDHQVPILLIRFGRKVYGKKLEFSEWWTTLKLR